MGIIDNNGELVIKGRIKELIITAGGENISPILIENEINENLKQIISKSVVIGDKRKFLSILLTLKTDLESDGSPTNKLT